MEIEYMVEMLDSKDTSEAFKALQELEKISDDSDAIYPYMAKFIEMIKSDKYVIRVRGFRLFCKQAKWDDKNIIDKNMESALNILYDEKPTAVRQSLAALLDLIPYKKNLLEIIKSKVDDIDPYMYKDTMHNLLKKDKEAVYKLMEEI